VSFIILVTVRVGAVVGNTIEHTDTTTPGLAHAPKSVPGAAHDLAGEQKRRE
jgi:hypothetical protein